jgi:putative FmdB family regulatory protein
MPIYEFRCPSCGHQFEELVFRSTEIDELTCPKCGSTEITRVLSSFASGSTSRAGGGSSGCGPGSFS